MQRLLLLCLLPVLLSACASGPANMAYEGCEAHILKWTYGPDEGTPYLDMCYTSLDISELKKYYVFQPIPGNNADTGQVIDANRDGISDGIRRNARVVGDKIWWGAVCQQSALRVQQQGCTQLGNSLRTAGCDWVAIHIQAKPGVKDQYVELSPVWHVRLPDGKEENHQARTLTTGFKECR